MFVFLSNIFIHKLFTEESLTINYSSMQSSVTSFCCDPCAFLINRELDFAYVVFYIYGSKIPSCSCLPRTYELEEDAEMYL